MTPACRSKSIIAHPKLIDRGRQISPPEETQALPELAHAPQPNSSGCSQPGPHWARREDHSHTAPFV